MCEKGIPLTSSFFPRCETRVDQARFPLGIAVDPFSEEIEYKNFVLPFCSNCGAYPTKKDEGSFAQTRWTCDFCDHKNETEIPFDFSDAVDFEVQVDEKHAQSLFLVDSSQASVASGFFSAVIGSLDSSIPDDMVNFSVASFSQTCSFLTQKKQILTLSSLEEESILPREVWLKSRPETFAPLLKEANDENAIHHPSFNIANCLKLCANILMPNSRVTVFIGSQPTRFKPLDREAVSAHRFSSPNIQSSEEIQQLMTQLHNRNIYVSFLCYREDKDIDILSFSQISDILGGEFILLESDQLKDVPQYCKEMCSSIAMRCQLRTLNSVKIGSSYGFRPRNPNDFPLLSTESVIFPASVVSLDKKMLPIQLRVVYFSHNGHKRIRVITRYVTMTDVLVHIFNNADSDMLSKLIIAQIIEQILLNNPIDLSKFVRDITWPIYWDYQRNGLFMEKVNEEQVLMPKSLTDFPRKCLALMHCSAFSPSTEIGAQLYQLRRLTTCRSLLLKRVLNARPKEMETKEPIYPMAVYMEENTNYFLFDGFTTYFFGGNPEKRDIDPELIKETLIDIDETNYDYFKERFIYDDTPYAPGNEKFMADLLEDVKTSGHKWVLYIPKEELPKDFFQKGM